MNSMQFKYSKFEHLNNACKQGFLECETFLSCMWKTQKSFIELLEFTFSSRREIYKYVCLIAC